MEFIERIVSEDKPKMYKYKKSYIDPINGKKKEKFYIADPDIPKGVVESDLNREIYSEVSSISKEEIIKDIKILKEIQEESGVEFYEVVQVYELVLKQRKLIITPNSSDST